MVRIQPLSDVAGASVQGLDLREALHADQQQMLADALHQFGFIVIKQQSLAPADLGDPNSGGYIPNVTHVIEVKGAGSPGSLLTIGGRPLAYYPVKRALEAIQRTARELGQAGESVDAGSAQTLVRQVDKDKLAIALKGANQTMRDFFLSQMSTRAAKMLADDMQALGPMRLKDVDEAQAMLVNLAKDLAAKGEIMISKNRADDELIF